MSDDLGAQLHDRATRGEALSPEEQKQLERWYEAQDRAEEEALASAATVVPEEVSTSEIRSLLTRIADATRQIQEVTAENEILRSDVAALQAQLARQSSAQSG